MKYDKRAWEAPEWLICLDLDGVLVDWTGAKDSEKWSNYQSDDLPFEFWANLEWLPHGKLLYSELQKLAPVIIVTASTNGPASAAGKMEWINRELKTRDYLIGGAKWGCSAPNHILVDDNEKKVARFISAGGKAVLVPKNIANPWLIITEVKSLMGKINAPVAETNPVYNEKDKEGHNPIAS